MFSMALTTLEISSSEALCFITTSIDTAWGWRMVERHSLQGLRRWVYGQTAPATSSASWSFTPTIVLTPGSSIVTP